MLSMYCYCGNTAGCSKCNKSITITSGDYPEMPFDVSFEIGKLEAQKKVIEEKIIKLKSRYRNTDIVQY